MNLIPKKMKAAVLVELHKPLEIIELDLPDNLGVGQVLVKVLFSGICGSQLGEIDGVKGDDKFLPHLMGHEGSGIVMEVGPGVSEVTSGDLVVLHWRKGLGIESSPPSYKWNGRKVNAGWITTFSEYTIVSENRLTKIPVESDPKVVALFGCAVTTGFGVVTNNAALKIGESVVIFGSGGVGLNIVQASALSSAYPIIAIDLHDNKLKLAERMGATHLINAKERDARQAIIEICPTGVDVFIDNTGKPSIIEMGYEIVKPKGRVILVGVPKIGQNTSIYSLSMHFGKKMIGSHGGEAVPHEDIPRYLKLYQSGRILLDELITHEFNLDDINAAINGIRSGEVTGRCVINMAK